MPAAARYSAEAVEDAIAKQFAAIESDLGASHPLGFYFAGKPEALPYFVHLISQILSSQGAASGATAAGRCWGGYRIR